MEFKIKLKSKFDTFHDKIIESPGGEYYRLSHLETGTYEVYKLRDDGDMEFIRSDLGYESLEKLILEHGYRIKE